jgi:hypothetical protein
MFVYVLALEADGVNASQIVLVLLTHHAVPSVHGRVGLQNRNKTRHARVFDANTHVDIT